MKRINYANESFVVSDAGAAAMMGHAAAFLQILGAEAPDDSNVTAAIKAATTAVTITELDGTPVSVPATPWVHVSVRAHAFDPASDRSPLDLGDPLG
jgi:hypothetical protein